MYGIIMSICYHIVITLVYKQIDRDRYRGLKGLTDRQTDVSNIIKPHHCNQQYDQEHQYIYTSYYWHMPLNKYVCHMAQTCPTVLIL